MNIKDFFPDLVVTKTIHDDFVEFRLGFSNDHQGAMIITVDTFGLPEDDHIFGYPPGDVRVSFEASREPHTVADTGTINGLVSLIDNLMQKVKEEACD